MFIYSVKTSKKQLISILVCVVMLIVILLVAIFWPEREASPTSGPVAAAGEAEYIAFLTELGYEVDPAEKSVKEILIPETFDDVFTQYNDLQKTAGMDLEPYQGKRVKCWTYPVVNYPSDSPVEAHLYIYKDKIIGGDIASTALDGFMIGLSKQAAG